MIKRSLLALLGCYVLLAGAVVHRHMSGGWPWGVLLAIGLTWLIARGTGRVIPLGVTWFGLGWALGLLALQFEPGGGFLVGSDAQGWTFTCGAMGAIAFEGWRTPRLGK